MSKYDGEITSLKQKLSNQHTRQKQLESFLERTRKKDERVNQLPIRNHSLVEGSWRDKSSNTCVQMIDQCKRYYSNQVARVETMLCEVQKEIERGNQYIGDYQNDVQYYANLNRLEEAKNV
ncbi:MULTISPECIES: hypothetical protein [Listeria]|uniref:hypothetical protein n=1 Tax=Listeria TaxID=1637 RepID=UPI000B5904F8|nr:MULTISPECIES: hypothetical protein [Listeria]